MRKLLGAAATLALVTGMAVAGSATAAHAACSGVSITPSSSVQSVINANGTGTTFCFASGTYTNVSSVIPKSNDVLDGNGQGAILDGGNTRQFAFKDGGTENAGTNDGASGVTIQGFTMKNYVPPQQQGVITAYSGLNWVIQANNISNNAEAAVGTGDGVRVLNNTLDSNGREAFSAHGTGGLYQGNDMSGNNSNLANDGTFEAGGGKCWETTSLTFDSNTVNNNGGPGIWCDTSNIGTIIKNNTVKNNWGPGIYEEISYDFRITGNDVEGNGTAASPGGGQNLGWAWDAGIQIRLSQGGIDGGGITGWGNDIISGNTVYDNYNGISLIDSPLTGCGLPPEGKYGACHVKNTTISGNGITMIAGMTGGVQDGAGNAIFTSDNNTWTGNAYCVSPLTHPSGDPTGFGSWYQWNNSGLDFPGWQAAGNDTAGTQTVTTSKCLPPAGTAPVVNTTAATGVTSTGATLNGNVNPEGLATTYQFEYGTTTGYGTTIPTTAGSAGSGTSAVSESASPTGLTASTTYHYRLNATNSAGTTHGGDQTFTTAAAGGGGLAYDATGAGAKCASCSSLSENHTVSGSNTALLAGVSVGFAGTSSDANCVVAATYNGIPMISQGKVHTDNQAHGFEQVFGLAGPVTGTHAVAVTVSGCSGGTPRALTLGSESFNGAAQTGTFGTAKTAFGSSGTASVVTTGSISGDIEAGFAAAGSPVSSATSPSTSRYILNNDTCGTNGCGSTAAGNGAGATSPGTGSNVTLAWSVLSDWWGVVAVQVAHA
jgi:parallel beta-helix repeat protein